MNKRKKLWLLLSEIYLDNDISNTDMDVLANEISALGFTWDEINEIDRYEVFPSLYPNLLSVAGVWDAFEENWLISKCQSNREQSGKAFFRWKYGILWRIFSFLNKTDRADLRSRLDNS